MALRVLALLVAAAVVPVQLALCQTVVRVQLRRLLVPRLLMLAVVAVGPRGLAALAVAAMPAAQVLLILAAAAAQVSVALVVRASLLSLCPLLTIRA